MATTKLPEITGMTLVLSTLVLFVSNAIVLYFAQMFFPHAIVLGTHALSFWWAIFMSMGKLSLLGAAVMPFVGKYENMRHRIFSPMEWSVLYFVVNFIGLWIISRFSEQFGLGVTSWIVIAALALVLDIVQGVVMMAYGKMLKK
ncbi:MAG: hypothetical protein ABI758_04675 [Candidatus Woesebacteria bacterium]